MSETKRHAFYVDETMYTPNGYVPALVTEDEPGYSPMIGTGEHARPWYWGTDIATARDLVREANEKLGLSETDARKIVESSIGAQIRDDAKDQEAQERWDRIRKGRE